MTRLLRTAGVCLSLLVCSPIALAQEDEPLYGTLDDALAAAKKRARLEGKLGPGVGEAAVSELSDASSRQMALLLRVALAADLEVEAARELLVRCAEDPDGELGTGRLLTKLSPPAVFEGSKQVPTLTDALSAQLKKRVAGTPPAWPRTVLAWVAPKAVLAEVLEEFSRLQRLQPFLPSFLAQLKRTSRPVDAFDALIDAKELPQSAHDALVVTLNALVKDAKVRRRLIERLKAKETSPWLYRALGGMPRNLAKKYESWLVKRLQTESGEALAQAIYAAASLRYLSAVPRIAEVMGSGDAERIAALRVGPGLLQRAQDGGRDVSRALDEAKRGVQEGLDHEGELRAEAIRAAGQMKLEVPSRRDLQAWLRDTDQPLVVRRAALAVYPQRIKFNRTNCEVLIDLLAELKLSSDVQRALTIFSGGVKLPARPELWRGWLEAEIQRRAYAPKKEASGGPPMPVPDEK